MKALLVAVGLVVAGTAVASANPWDRGRGHRDGYRNLSSVCREKADHLRSYERRAYYGRLTHRDREVMAALERDLETHCDRYRR